MTSKDIVKLAALEREADAARRAGDIARLQMITAQKTMLLRATYGQLA